MVIEDFIEPAHVHVGLRAGDKQRLLAELARLAAPTLAISPNIIEDALVTREKLGSTGLGDGIALPHASLPPLRKPFGLLAILKSSVPFDAIDDRPVDLVLLLLLPTGAAGAHLCATAAAVRKLRDPRVAAALRRAPGALDAYAILVNPSA